MAFSNNTFKQIDTVSVRAGFDYYNGTTNVTANF